jgi:polysaccharide biosynthesis/export protein
MKLKGKRHYINATAFLFLLTAFLASCSPTKDMKQTDFPYFENGPDIIALKQKQTTIQPNDILSIQVYSKTTNQEQAAIFNIPVAPTAGNASSTGQSNNQQGYLVNAEGNIEIPVIGPVKAAGLTISQLQTTLVQKLSNSVKDPAVIVEFMQFNINILGEVHAPGTHKFNLDRVTLLDAIGAAGDLTDYGRRDNIMVIREEKEKKVTYTVDLRDKNIFQSPVYIMEPNDIVYVNPNKYKLHNLTVNPERQRMTSLFFAVVSASVSVATLILVATHY